MTSLTVWIQYASATDGWTVGHDTDRRLTHSVARKKTDSRLRPARDLLRPRGHGFNGAVDPVKAFLRTRWIIEPNLVTGRQNV